MNTTARNKERGLRFVHVNQLRRPVSTRIIILLTHKVSAVTSVFLFFCFYKFYSVEKRSSAAGRDDGDLIVLIKHTLTAARVVFGTIPARVASYRYRRSHPPRVQVVLGH